MKKASWGILALMLLGTVGVIASDPTIAAKVQMTNGGDTLTVISGGTLSVESGATFTVANTPTFTGNVDFSEDVILGSASDDLVTVTGTATFAEPVVFTKGANTTATARTATADGLTTGIVASGTGWVTVTSANASHIVTLPAPTVGHIIHLYVGANGYELKSSTPASIGINGGTGAAVSASVGASVLVTCRCVSATAWVCSTFAADGTEAKLEAAH